MNLITDHVIIRGALVVVRPRHIIWVHFWGILCHDKKSETVENDPFIHISSKKLDLPDSAWHWSIPLFWIGFWLSWPDNAAHSICIMVSSSTRPNRHYLKCTNHQVGFLVVAANKPQISITPIRVRFLRWSLSFWSILFCRQIWGVHRVPLSKIKRTSIIRSLMYKRQT